MISAGVSKSWRYVDPDDNSPREATTVYQLAVDAAYSPDVADDLTSHLARMIARIEDDLEPDVPSGYDPTFEERDQ